MRRRFAKRLMAIALAASVMTTSMPTGWVAAEEIENATVAVDEETVAVDEDTATLKTVEDLVPATEMEEESVIMNVTLLENADGTIPYIGDAFADRFIDVLNANGIRTTVLLSDGTVEVTIGEGQNEILELLSQMTQTATENYADWKIKFSFSGNLTLGSDFSGLGDPEIPFEGAFTDQAISIRTSHTLFKGLSAGADLNGVKLEWTGTPDKAILADTLVPDQQEHVINMPLTSSASFSAFIGTLARPAGDTADAQLGVVTLPALNYSNAKDSPGQEVRSSDYGLLCGAMAAGTQLQLAEITLPAGSNGQAAVIDLRGSENVGSLVGSMAANAQLFVGTESAAVDLVLNTKLTGKNAGGLAGKVSNAVISFAEGSQVALTTEITAGSGGNGGGLVGDADTENGILAGPAVLRGTPAVTLTSVKVDSMESAANAGIYYGNCRVTGLLDPLAGVEAGATGELTGTGNCGGIFGRLQLEGEGKCQIGGSAATADAAVEISSRLTLAGNATAYGGIAGEITGADRKNALIVKKAQITTTVELSKPGENYYPKYVGGVAAVQRQSTVDALEVTTIFNNPTIRNAGDYGFGGLVSNVQERALVIADTVTVNSPVTATKRGGGGLAGSTKQGSILILKNSVDLSACILNHDGNNGQIVGNQNSSLIYGEGCAIKRYANGLLLDDIGNYGEIYRVPGFVTVSEDGSYTVTLPQLARTGNTCQLATVTDYACYALAWQSQGNFPTVSGIDTSNWKNLKEKDAKIELAEDIDLTGCGIGGLSRDVDDDNNRFRGSFNGNGKTLTLSIGERNAANYADTLTQGDGKIYRHTAIGLFAGLSNTASVQKLTLSGNIRANNTYNIMCGALAAKLACDTNGVSSSALTKVSTDRLLIDFDVDTSRKVYIGGLIGVISGGSTAKLVLDSSLNAEIRINPANGETAPQWYGQGSGSHVAEAIGCVLGEVKALTLEVDGAVIGGRVIFTQQRIDKTNVMKTGLRDCYFGGLVGDILPVNNSSESRRKVIVTDLDFDQLMIDCVSADRRGGIFGGIWADTEVELNGLRVTDATITDEKGTPRIGGLVYRATGKWTVRQADLSGLKIRVASAKALGLLVCQGGSYKDKIDGGISNIGGLYLEMASDWETGYLVPADGNLTINDANVVVDEFVAYTAYADSNTDADTYPSNYQITASGSGVISLKTPNDTVNMTSGERNTYLNRTDLGKTKQTNAYSRYYYNLPTVLSAAKQSGGAVDTAQELLMWSVYRYAASNIREYFDFDGKAATTLGGASAASRASFDMEGLSYYPISLINQSMTLQYADVRFYNQEIEDKEAVDPNKTTRGDAASHAQHYTMHCGLFYDFKADLKNSTSYEKRTLTVNGLTLAGTVGAFHNGSGALICGTVSGDFKEGQAAICQIVLADENKADKAVVLNGLSIAPAGDYTPVLINRVETYSDLRAKYLVTGEQQNSSAAVAGSSLIGDVGSEIAQDISLQFSGTIRLKESGVFSKAILLNSLRYAKGSATYNFFMKDDWDGDTWKHDATYGKEISTTVEFSGRQGCYYDAFGPGYYVSKTGSFDQKNDFTGYLPYVLVSSALGDTEHTVANGWHEIAVNVLSDDLIEGCGTYGHPYVIDSAGKLAAVANCINSGVIANGWKLRVKEDTTYHADTDGDHCQVLTYQDSKWKKEDDSAYDSSFDAQTYLANAYYLIKTENQAIRLKNFTGLGTNGTGGNMGIPFSGVIVGAPGAEIVLEGTTPSLIQYSYGSVVKDLKIVLNQTLELKRDLWSKGDAETTPTTFFGGLIGCVLGGDNIIDEVQIEKGTGFQVSHKANNTNKHLFPVGGYVGVVAGGGVVLRGEISNNLGPIARGAANDRKALYDNPIIGRVLDGFAFYEGDGTVPDNTDKNYTISRITPNSESDFTWDGTNLRVNTAQGLYLVSALISSGGAGTISKAYANGRARNASYEYVGEAQESEATSRDYAVALKDEGKAWANGNTPHILNTYAGYTGTAPICGHAGLDLTFAGGTFDMSVYKNGYRGISARYVSNAAFGSSGVDPFGVALRMRSFDGGNTTVTGIRMNVEEYTNDDFHAASVGGIFNYAWTSDPSKSKAEVFAANLTVDSIYVRLQYVNSDGSDGVQADRENTNNPFKVTDGCSCVNVGGIFGSVSDIASSDSTRKNKTWHNYLLKNLHVRGTSRSTVIGHNAAGGLIGATSMVNQKVTGKPGVLLSGGKLTSATRQVTFAPSLVNCTYADVDIEADLSAGGLIGQVYLNTDGKAPDFEALGDGFANASNTSSSVTAVTAGTETELIVGQNATITAKANHSIAGGLFGGIGMSFRINTEEAGEKTGLKIIGSGERLVDIRIKDVVVKGSAGNANGEGYFISGGGLTVNNGKEGVSGDAAAAGCVGRIGNINPSWFNRIHVENCTIEARVNANNNSAGGLLAICYINSQTVSMENCEVVDSSVKSSNNAGGLIGFTQNHQIRVYLSNCKVSESSVQGARAGGVIGSAYGTNYFSNLMVKNVSVTGKNNSSKTGQVFGYMNIDANNSNFWVYAAGMSIFADDSKVTLPDRVGDKESTNRQYIGYISYADYAGLEEEVPNFQAPYATSNPSVLLTGSLTDTLANQKWMTGDATGKLAGDSYGAVAARLWADSKLSGLDGRASRVVYDKISNIVASYGEEEPEVSTFNTVHELTGTSAVANDFPVLVVDAKNVSMIEDYINVITNGGYTESEEKLSSQVYYYDPASGSFSKATAAQLKAEPASIYLYNNQTPRVASNAYDNTRNRFTLIEVTFTTDYLLSSGTTEKRTYTVSVPVVVKRELQYNFMSTFTYGTEFMADTFQNLDVHVLESTGNPVTAYLTYQYNRERSAYVEYDWQSYLETGGSMMSLDKKLIFSSSLPKGTQFTLVDPQNGNRAYQFATTAASSGRTEIKLSQFTSVSDGSRFVPSMGDVLGITAAEEPDGQFVLESDPAKATVRIGGKDYRAIKEGETVAEGTRRYELTVPDLEQMVPEENYYLVMTVPNQGPDFYLNGALSSTLEWNMPSKVTWVHRHNVADTSDPGNNHESTYQISSGYTQELTSTAMAAKIDVATGDPVQVLARDVISFSKDQIYGESDHLYFMLDVELLKRDKNAASGERLMLPAGTCGAVKFYISDGNGTCYDLNGNIVAGKTKAAGYDWTYDGLNAQLLLSNDGENLISLARVRDAVKRNCGSALPKIVIDVEMELQFTSPEVMATVIPASQENGTDQWAELHYSSAISTQASMLKYSTVRASVGDKAGYYRNITFEAVLSMDANAINQLGINPLELVPEYAAKRKGHKASRIGIVSALNLANLKDIELVLSQTESITFTLSLKRGGRKSYGNALADGGDYIDFDLSAYGSDSWSWTVPQSEYYADGALKTDGIFDGVQFTMPFNAYVFADQKNYANYRIELEANFNGTQVSIGDSEAYLVYTYACIKPEYYDPTI
ncbi:MAG: hypothetical protein Q4B59_00620 [Lachnospiraceae bacterium]|nr:hypothetical protein [Lachnospiraceae bacterium]